MAFASIILTLISIDNLGNKQVLFFHSYLFKDSGYDLIIIPHKTKNGQIRSKKQTKKKALKRNIS